MAAETSALQGFLQAKHLGGQADTYFGQHLNTHPSVKAPSTIYSEASEAEISLQDALGLISQLESAIGASGELAVGPTSNSTGLASSVTRIRDMSYQLRARLTHLVAKVG